MAIEDEATRSWIEYRALVLAELERLSALIMVLDKKIDDLATTQRRDIQERDAAMWTHISGLKIEVAMLQVKSGVWGAVAGLVVVVATILVQYLVRH